MIRSVTITYLEMRDASQHRPSKPPTCDFEFMQASAPCPELNRFFYTSVGANWHWYSRLSWDYRRWFNYLNRAELETWIGYVSGTPAGYVELERQSGDDVEIVYFGLLPSFVGRSLGGPLLSAAISRAWQMGAARVWVHTCSLDHPGALKNYEARGFRIYQQVEQTEELPDEPFDPWLTAISGETP